MFWWTSSRLRRQLFSDDAAQRRRAVDELVKKGLAGLEIFLRALREGTPATRVAAAEGLAQIGGEEAVESLTGVIEDNRYPDVRRAAVDGLIELGAAEPLLAHLDEFDLGLQLHVVASLAKRGDGRVLEALLAQAVLQRYQTIETHHESLADSLDWLNDLGSAAVTPLRDAALLNRYSEKMVAAVLNALGRIKHPEAMAALREIEAKTADPRTHAQSLKLLAIGGDARALDQLVQGLADIDRPVVADPEVQAALDKLGHTTPQQEARTAVRKAAANALWEMRWQPATLEQRAKIGHLVPDMARYSLLASQLITMAQHAKGEPPDVGPLIDLLVENIMYMKGGGWEWNNKEWWPWAFTVGTLCQLDKQRGCHRLIESLLGMVAANSNWNDAGKCHAAVEGLEVVARSHARRILSQDLKKLIGLEPITITISHYASEDDPTTVTEELTVDTTTVQKFAREEWRRRTALKAGQ